MFKDTHAPVFWLIARSHWPYNDDESGGCTNQVDSLIAIDTQLYDQGVSVVDSVAGAGSNMTLFYSTPRDTNTIRSYGFRVVVKDSLFNGHIVLLSFDTSHNISYDTLRYCTVPDTLPPILNVPRSKLLAGWHIHASDSRPWDRGVGCVYFETLVNATVVLPPGVDSTRSGDALIICSAKCDTSIDFEVRIIDTFQNVSFTARVRDCSGNWGVKFPLGYPGLVDALCPGVSWQPPMDTSSGVTQDSVAVTVSDYHYTTQGHEINYDKGLDSVWFTNVHNVDLYLPAAAGDRGAGLYSPPVSIHFSGDPKNHPQFPKSVAFMLRIRDKHAVDSLSACATVNAVDGGGNTICSADTVTWCQPLSQDLYAPQAQATNCTDASIVLTLTDTRPRDEGLKKAWLDAATNINFIPFDTTYVNATTSDTRTLKIEKTGKSARATVHVIDLAGTQGASGHETQVPVWIYAQNLRMDASRVLIDTGMFDVPVYLVASDTLPLSQKQLAQYQFTFQLQGSPLVAFLKAVTTGTLSSGCVVTPAPNLTYSVAGNPVGGTLPDLMPAQMAQTPLLILRFNGPAAAPASPARCNIIVTGTPGAEVMYNGGADSVTKGANYNYTVTTCPPYGTLAGGTVIIKGACSPVLASNTLPTAIHLSTASPNPAATATTVTYDIPADGLVMLELYNVYGTLVRTAVAAMQQQGEYTIQLSLEDLPMGSYILRLETGGMAKSRKIVVWR